MPRINQLSLFFIFFVFTATAGNHAIQYRVIAFYTAKNDQAHISFVHEANRWFASVSAKNHFSYKATNNWNDLGTVK